MHDRHWIWLGLVLLLTLCLIGGCAQQQAEESGGGEERVAGAEERTRNTESPTEVDVGLTEYAIALDPQQAPAGDVRFNVSNNGDVVHAFEVEGHGIEQSTPRLQPGETATLRVNNMEPGEYVVYCPVGNHEERGMRDTFRVTRAGEN